MSKIYKRDCTPNRVRAGMRWFGPEDIVTIHNIRQTPGITNVISALHHIPAGEIWTAEEVAKRKIEVEFLASDRLPCGLSYEDQFSWYQKNGKASGLIWDTAESLVFTEEIKNGNPARIGQIDNYKKSLKNLGKYGVTTVVGNFMLVADWTRTGFNQLHDGSLSLEYIHDAFMAFDIFLLKRHKDIQKYIEDGSYTQSEIESAKIYWQEILRDNPEHREGLTKMITAGLPGAQEGFTLANFRAALENSRDMDSDGLRANIAFFLDAVVPVAKEAGVLLCCHADDPAFSPFMGTPRAVGNSAGYKFLLKHGCGVNLCIGSLMPNEDNCEITKVIYELAAYGKSLGLTPTEIFPHIHLRPIETDGKNFREGHHAEHREELATVVHALLQIGWKGIFRPDHAPASDHGFGRLGYDLVGRGYGAQLLLGLFEMCHTIKATTNASIEAAVKACDGNLNKLDLAISAANKVEQDIISDLKPHIKMPFHYDINDDWRI